MAYNAAAGLSGMMKDGTQHYEQDQSSAAVVLRNIDACIGVSKDLAKSGVRTCPTAAAGNDKKRRTVQDSAQGFNLAGVQSVSVASPV